MDMDANWSVYALSYCRSALYMNMEGRNSLLATSFVLGYLVSLYVVRLHFSAQPYRHRLRTDRSCLFMSFIAT